MCHRIKRWKPRSVFGESGLRIQVSGKGHVTNDPISDFRTDIRHAASARTNSALCPFNLSLRQTRLAQPLGNALKLGKEDNVIGPTRPILQPKGNGVIGPEPTKLGDGCLSFTLMFR